jgi:xanthine dehydrogenase accessory factor
MADVFEEVCRLKREGGTGVLITVVDKVGQGPGTVGKKLLVRSDGQRIGTVGGGEIEYLAIKRAEELVRDRKNDIKTYDFSGQEPQGGAVAINMICGGRVTLYFEYIGTVPSVYIFGAGHVGKFLAEILARMDYRTVLIDDRDEIPVKDPQGYEFIHGDYNEIIKSMDFPSDCFIVVASYTHEVEYIVLKALYEKGCRPAYLGVLASKNKASHMIGKLKEEIQRELDFSMFHAPIGLEIGGTSPQEIAISIMSEIQSIRYGKTGNRHMTAVWS